MDVVQALQFSTSPRQDFKTWLDLKGPEEKNPSIGKESKQVFCFQDSIFILYFQVFLVICKVFLWLFNWSPGSI